MMILAREPIHTVLAENASGYGDFEDSFWSLLRQRFESKYHRELQAIADALLDLYPLDESKEHLTHWEEVLFPLVDIEGDQFIFFVDHFNYHDEVNVNLLHLRMTV